MNASQYKDYILTLLFVKYVSDKCKDAPYGAIAIPKGASFEDLVALKDNKNIGEKIDKLISKLAEANNLTGIIDNAHFNDEAKIGKGYECFLSEYLLDDAKIDSKKAAVRVKTIEKAKKTETEKDGKEFKQPSKTLFFIFILTAILAIYLKK